MSVCTVRSIARSFVLTTLFLILAVSVANAYTIVLRDGRRVEIPSNFIVTQSTLTYQVQPGIQVTLQLAVIDVSATEKANNEKPGALSGRVQITNLLRVVPLATARPATKTITNRDLEATAQRRVASEAAYEKRRKELGLPTAAESRRQAEVAAAIAQEELHDRIASERQTEEHWRARADALRTEMTALDAEIRFVRIKLEETPFLSGGGSFSSVTGLGTGISFGGFGGRSQFGGYRSQRASVYSAPRRGPQLSGRVGFGGGSTRGRVLLNPGQGGRGHFGRGARWGRSVDANIFGTRIGIWPSTTLFGSSPAYDHSWERSELVTRFNDLSTTRAGLSARWRELEDEARRAGAPPGWLRK